MTISGSSYGDAMSRVVPGTFVPDIAPGAPKAVPLPSQEVAGAGATSFRDTVKSMLAGVNDKMATSDTLTQQLASGQTHDTAKVVTSVEEANLAFEFTLAIRNKLLSAYQEISQMQV
ncbi:MAG: flagellar hook-basal body complex protein FliE [Vulcanimicrobiaceae bacterium]